MDTNVGRVEVCEGCGNEICRCSIAGLRGELEGLGVGLAFKSTEDPPLPGLKPHKCPVCEGRTEMPCDFYGEYENVPGMGGTKVQCRSCKGAGYLLIL